MGNLGGQRYDPDPSPRELHLQLLVHRVERVLRLGEEVVHDALAEFPLIVVVHVEDLLERDRVDGVGRLEDCRFFRLHGCNYSVTVLAQLCHTKGGKENSQEARIVEVQGRVGRRVLTAINWSATLQEERRAEGEEFS